MIGKLNTKQRQNYVRNAREPTATVHGGRGKGPLGHGVAFNSPSFSTKYELSDSVKLRGAFCVLIKQIKEHNLNSSRGRRGKSDDK